MKLADFRKIRGMTQLEMAKHIKVSPSHYSKVELGLRNPSYNFIARMKTYFPELDVNDMFFRNDGNLEMRRPVED